MNENLLGNCRACGRQVSRRAKECPECREPQPTWTEEEYEKTRTPNKKRLSISLWDLDFFILGVLIISAIIFGFLEPFGFVVEPFVRVVIISLVIIDVIVGVLIAGDASSRGMNGFGWGTFTLFVPIMAVLVYLAVRKPRNIDDLPPNSQLKATTPAASLLDELQNLADLKEKGVLSEEEFQAANKKLIEE
ncbi:TPA: hypothetical protein EYN98_16415 [Candidatus Poribacteria bacterium]|nr:hypothetical protein [Candidatus Poribacteria bacterium]